ncbi:GTP-binding protein SAR1b-like isoform X2 [Histomonas meleagridis]|uniref:GTP-binding protein SAR1b-like isoform X2 n=1 Tax=Histomonas meleagridis TaxID=135588 RepID=UPI00355A7CC4|nr:GTP-binding protein SAR1b-like isoform X2 [Histomonas meleagridis]KAH0797395.1 GTP-binding protein SAR1b-like isoform X2 [Histomonas meleagridis]
MGLWDWLMSFFEWLGLKNKSGKLLFLGLDDAGKTTLMQMLKTGKFMQYDQTKTYTVENLTIEKISFSAYDLGGHEIARESWEQYYMDVSAIVFIVDAANPARFAEAKAEFDKLLSNETIRNTPILVLGNKIDKDGAVSDIELANALGIYNQTPENVTSVPPGVRPIRLFMCSIKRKSGFAPGFKWVAKFI